MEIKLYCGVGEMQWNHHPTGPGSFACISPVCGSTAKTQKENRVRIPKETKVMQDCGAFNDGPSLRLTPEKALERQLNHAKKYNYIDQITHIASYDLLIDERWNGIDSSVAVRETVDNAKWLHEHRDLLPEKVNCVLTAQGTTPQEYKECAEQIVPLLQEEDVFGFGGWCSTGKMRRKRMPLLAETMSLVFPVLHKYKIKRVHVWGVILAEALAEMSYWCDLFGIELSTDSVGPSIYPAFGKWGYADWIDKSYVRPDPAIRGLERAKHVQAVRDWLGNFEYEKYLHPLYAEYRIN